MTTREEIESLYRTLLDCWDRRDAAGYGALFVGDGSIVGYDGSAMNGAAAVTDHLASIFADHTPATYVAKVRDVRSLGPDVALLTAVVGMVPPGRSDIDPGLNAVQSLVATRTAGDWRIAHFQNTPAAYFGRPEEAEALTAELRALR